MNVLYERDIDGAVLRGRRIAMIGYGSQGHAQALNLNDSGHDIVVGLRPESRHADAAREAGLTVLPIADAVARADVVMLMIPDECQPAVYAAEIEPHLRPGAYLGFAHGLAVHFGKIVPAADTNVFLVAPKGPGPQLRRRFLAGSGLAALIAVHQDPTGNTRAMALAYAAGIGSGRVGILETTFREECETDLFGEQVVLCGGIVELIRGAFETLTEAGYAPEMAYFECLHEAKLITDLIFERGIADMRKAISNTAEFGGVTRGPRVIGPAARQAMREILAEIQSGAFADEWLKEHAAGCPTLAASAAREDAHPIESVGRELRRLMT
ncbi:MAG: ketol-acid reductoisomerase [Phycisphaerae bacterium]|nr:ketol-acid reductoisomerase [Phycisphaerae bacterium]